MNLIELAETGLLPDWLIRLGIRRLLAKRLKNLRNAPKNSPESALSDFAKLLRHGPLAIQTDDANTQHYEVPAEFFQLALGPHLKYSSCLFESEDASLAAAEETMLRITCQRAEIENGMSVLELGCGWGSLTLWMAEQFPGSQIAAVSNSASQKDFILRQAKSRGLENVRVITADMREFDIDEQFDRVVSVEMFEHMRNYGLLFQRIGRWLVPDGKMFVHIFCHKTHPYMFETEGASNWMGRNFFSGGIMPAEHLFHEFADDLKVAQQWRVNGKHYWRTCEAWLKNLDDNRAEALTVFQLDHDLAKAKRMVQRWRMFFMACAELFRYNNGEEWFVGHYLFEHAHQMAKPAGTHSLSGPACRAC